MPNNTQTYWEINGESLHTYAHSIESIGPGMVAPPMRGENLVVPGRVGQISLPKVADSRTLSLGMWVRGDTRAEFDANWHKLVRLIYQPGLKLQLTKRFYNDSGVIVSATATAEYAGGLEPSMIGRNAAKFVVEFFLADPYFYSAAGVGGLVTVPIGSQVPLDVPGNAPTQNLALALEGPLSYPTLTYPYDPFGTDLTLSYDGVLSAATDMVTILVNGKMAFMNTASDPDGFDVSSLIRTSGLYSGWFGLTPGSGKSIRLTHGGPAAGAGKAYVLIQGGAYL